MLFDSFVGLAVTCDCDSSGPSEEALCAQSRPDESSLRESMELLSLWIVSQKAEFRSLLDKLVTHASFAMTSPRKAKRKKI